MLLDHDTALNFAVEITTKEEFFENTDKARIEEMLCVILQRTVSPGSLDRLLSYFRDLFCLAFLVQ